MVESIRMRLMSTVMQNANAWKRIRQVIATYIAWPTVPAKYY